MSERTYLAIDLKSFYASVECVERQLDPLTTNLVVADETRTEKTICLAVSPSLKAHKISGRARLFEVIQQVENVNKSRLNAAIRNGKIQKNNEGKYEFKGSSFDAEALKSDPTLGLSYIVAPPRMRLYEEYSSKIYSIYLKYVSKDDIVVYSIDEVFMDVTGYLDTYKMTAHELAMTMIREVLYTTGITATAGIGTNLYLAKVCMDINVSYFIRLRFIVAYLPAAFTASLRRNANPFLCSIYGLCPSYRSFHTSGAETSNQQRIRERRF